jgi:hypothetical protein
MKQSTLGTTAIVIVCLLISGIAQADSHGESQATAPGDAAASSETGTQAEGEAEAPMATLGSEQEGRAPFPYADITQDQQADYQAGLARLERLTGGASPPADANLFLCWAQRLKNGADDRLAEWTHMCPGISGGASASTCVRSALSEHVLGDAISSVDDVELADETLHFLSRLKAYLAVAHAEGSGGAGDQRFLGEMSRIGAEMALARARFRTLVVAEGGYGLASQYQAIQGWIEQKSIDTGSVVSCVAEHGSNRLSSLGGDSSAEAGSR